ncbi:MAG: F0F1 ATP synthase subunit B [Erysipelotrichaceae bacterium]|nr:F0F1 ATP synthase subunit B [Erysipelotrichaceae bacterium]
MNLDFDIYAYLRLSPTDVIIVCISTFLLVIFAKRFFWDKVLAFLDARKAAIQADIDSGEKQRMEGEAYKEQYEKRLADASKEAHELIETAKANAANEKRELLYAAKNEADNMKAKALADIEREKSAAQDEMKQAIVNVAFEAAKQIVDKEIDEKTHQRYVDEFIEHAGDETWQA